MTRHLAIVLLSLSLVSCQSFTWQGQNANISAEDRAKGLKDVATLAAEYESEAYWRSVRRRSDGRANAFGRDLNSIQTTIDRHFFNYSPEDPYVNFETNVGAGDHLVRFGTTLLVR